MMSATKAMKRCYANRSYVASDITTFVLAGLQLGAHNAPVLTQSEILNRIADRPRAEIARVLDIPATRVTEMYGGRRQLKLDEARKLIDHYELVETPLGLNGLVARLAVLYVAQQLGVDVDRSDPRLAETALDLQALAEFAARPEVQESVEAQLSGFLAGRKSQQQRQVTA